MKTNLVLIVIFFCMSMNLLAQEDCYEKIGQQAVQIDKLKESLQRSKDSLNKIIKQGVSENKSLYSRINRLKQDSAKLIASAAQIDHINQLEGDKTQLAAQMQVLVVKYRKDTTDLARLKFENKLIDKIKNDLATAVTQIAKQVDEIKQFGNERSQLLQAQQECLNILNNRYNGNFEDLLSNISVYTIEKDQTMLQVLSPQNNLQQKLKNLLLYKQAEALLSMKFDNTKIINIRNSLLPMMTEIPVKQLDTLLKGFQSGNEGLQGTIKLIQEDNQNKAGSISDLRSEKMCDIRVKLENYLASYQIDLTKYPYLNSIVNELIKCKQQNVDADVIDILNKL